MQVECVAVIIICMVCGLLLSGFDKWKP